MLWKCDCDSTNAANVKFCPECGAKNPSPIEPRWFDCEERRFERFIELLMMYRGLSGCPGCGAPEMDECVDDCPVRLYMAEIKKRSTCTYEVRR